MREEERGNKERRGGRLKETTSVTLEVEFKMPTEETNYPQFNLVSISRPNTTQI